MAAYLSIARMLEFAGVVNPRARANLGVIADLLSGIRDLKISPLVRSRFVKPILPIAVMHSISEPRPSIENEMDG